MKSEGKNRTSPSNKKKKNKTNGDEEKKMKKKAEVQSLPIASTVQYSVDSRPTTRFLNDFGCDLA